MPKKLIALLDGTWINAISQRDGFSNIHALAQSLSRRNQSIHYQKGVGGHAGNVAFLFRGATGKGVFEDARTSWSALASNYEDGDEVYIFGFSRGAFAARHLAGMIVRKGLTAYRGQIEIGFDDWMNEINTTRVSSVKDVKFLGLFDCVPANRLFSRNKQRLLNTPVLEPGIKNVRHALSSQERRWSYRPIIFDKNDGQESFKQLWFPGYHSDVGGRGSTGLGCLSLWWMIREAIGCGLAFENIDCPEHRYGSALSVVQGVDPRATSTSSDWWTTKLGIKHERKLDDKRVGPTPDYPVEMIKCPRCGRLMFM